MAILNSLVKVEKKNWIRASVILALIIGFMVYYSNVYTLTDIKEIIGKLSDCFFVPGALYAGVAGLTWVSSKGMFDSFSYIFRSFSLHSILPGTQPKKYISYYDFKQEKANKSKGWLVHVFLLGIACLALSLVILIIYLVI